jgi:ubiquinone/menaquinone biosynthesis C-methylase UbiE
MDASTATTYAQRYNLLESQTKHRINVLNSFCIVPGSKVLEIGCGQGDCTVVLAGYVSKSTTRSLCQDDKSTGKETEEDTRGEKGHITAIDPAPLDYGSPETLGQAQARHQASDIGESITFHRAEPIAFLETVEDGTFDVAVLCHCLWYFSSRTSILDTLKAVRGKCKRLCIAEWCLTTSRKDGGAYPHVLAALARAACETHIEDSEENIRTPVSPSAIMQLAKEAGWTLQKEEMIQPNDDLEDGRWEVGMLLRETSDGPGEKGYEFLHRARREIRDEKVDLLLASMLESVKGAMEGVGGIDKIRCMDVWVGVFV